MRVFIAHGSANTTLAQGVATKLRTSGIEVFVDEDSLPPGEEYDLRIRNAIERSDLFVVLVSEAAMKPGSYVLTEIGIAAELWPNPIGKILAVQVPPLDMQSVVPYLRSGATFLKTKGDAAAETAHGARRLLEQRRRRRWLKVCACICGVAVAAGTGVFLLARRDGGSAHTSGVGVPTAPPSGDDAAGRAFSTDAGQAQAPHHEPAAPTNRLAEVKSEVKGTPGANPSAPGASRAAGATLPSSGASGASPGTSTGGAPASDDGLGMLRGRIELPNCELRPSKESDLVRVRIVCQCKAGRVEEQLGFFSVATGLTEEPAARMAKKATAVADCTKQ